MNMTDPTAYHRKLAETLESRDYLAIWGRNPKGMIKLVADALASEGVVDPTALDDCCVICRRMILRSTGDSE